MHGRRWAARAPVGSWARSRARWLTIARAMASRCRSPPLNRDGKAGRSARPSRPRSRRAVPRFQRYRPASMAGTSTFSATVVVEQMEKLEDEADVGTADRAPAVSDSRLTRSPATSISPPDGRSSAPMRLSRVDFPQPDCPMTAVIRPSSMSRDTPWSAGRVLRWYCLATSRSRMSAAMSPPAGFAGGVTRSAPSHFASPGGWIRLVPRTSGARSSSFWMRRNTPCAGRGTEARGLECAR